MPGAADITFLHDLATRRMELAAPASGDGIVLAASTSSGEPPSAGFSHTTGADSVLQ